jgi:BirA family biotin operon repressor/biotin-[acetyl-CoA-carboxylase] ligase
LHRLHIYYLDIIRNREADVHAMYMQNLFWKEGIHPFFSKNDGHFEASVKEILPSGEILLEKTSGEEAMFAFKEVSFLVQ